MGVGEGKDWDIHRALNAGQSHHAMSTITAGSGHPQTTKKFPRRNVLVGDPIYEPMRA